MPVGAGVSFRCSRVRGAVLVLPDGAEGSDAHNLRAYKRYMVNNCKTWLSFFRFRGLDLCMEDIVLVTGCHFATSWAMAAFRTEESEASLQLQIGDSVGLVEVGWMNEHNVESRKAGPAGPLRKRDQCVFIRGYHVKSRVIRTPKKLKGAAGPSSDDHDDTENYTHELYVSSGSEDSTSSDCDVEGLIGMDHLPVSDSSRILDHRVLTTMRLNIRRRMLHWTHFSIIFLRYTLFLIGNA